MTAQQKGITTYYGKEDSGKVTFKRQEVYAEEIEKYIELIDQLKDSPDTDPIVLQGLEEVRHRLGSLLYSEEENDVVKKKIRMYTRVPLGDGKYLHLSSFLESKGETKYVETEDDYLNAVQKMVKNTESNLANLILFRQDDEMLKGLLEDLNLLKNLSDYEPIKNKVKSLNENGIIKHYNQVKLSFLKTWLSPFEKYLAKPVSQMSSKEIQNALVQVDNLKKKELSDIGFRLSAEKNEQMRIFNKEMHPLMNGERTDFWGYAEYRDEFVNLLNNAINRFSFKLENYFLIFETADKKIAYLVGFPEDTLYQAEKLRGERIGLVPHLKVLFSEGEEGAYKELKQTDTENLTEYYRTLKTAVVPFLASLSTILDIELSQGLRDAFEMWI